MTTPPARGIVLAGGGARGAYEAGVLCALLERMADRGLDRIDYVCGTSVGAIHAAGLASGLQDPATLAADLAASWSSLDLSDVIRTGPDLAFRLPALVFGGARGAGLLRPMPLADLLRRYIEPSAIRASLDAGRVRALTVTATHVPTGRPVVFLDRRDDVEPPDHVGRRVIVREEPIGLSHVLASASIPGLFPPVDVGGDLYVDGGLRLNTPLGPAVRLGADTVLVVGLSTPHEADGEAQLGPGRYPSAAFLAGKVLNAFLLDHVMGDLDETHRINRFLEQGTEACGPEFGDRLREVATARGDPAYRPVQTAVVRPSEDIGEIATRHVRRIRGRSLHSIAARAFLRILDAGEGAGSDLASYVLFDGAFARDLLELGHADAEAQGDELDAFLGGRGA